MAMSNWSGVLLLLACWGTPAGASSIYFTKHNLSAGSGNEVRASGEDQLCVFCHTPHGAASSAQAPLWNRQLPQGASYQAYSSSSLQATTEAPGGASKLCLSCHDGTLAIGAVNVANGQVAPTLTMTGAAAGGMMPSGGGLTTGNTRNLGTDLSNDHPISFTFDTELAARDGELYDPEAVAHIGTRSGGDYPLLPLDHDSKVQCTSCHDPHQYDEATGNTKFLRGQRLQQQPPGGAGFDAANDMICLGCHQKSGRAWSESVHASNLTASYSYTDTAADERGFPLGTKVWQAGCLNCHDSHTVQGAKRLLREGTDSLATPKAGGNPAPEETCYQCHSSLSNRAVQELGIADIRSDFVNKSRRMPITRDHQQRDHPHDIEDANLNESREKLGRNQPSNRHTTCTDCHNPHRVIRAPLLNAGAPASQGTHTHASGTLHSNLASGALRGSIGVEPIYANDTFEPDPIAADALIAFQVKQGAPQAGASTDVNQPYVTREYQVCLRCHSNYGFGTLPPTAGDSGGGTPYGTNGLAQYTNQAMEFNPPLADRGEPGGNHRSWHPVIGPTGRTDAVRRSGARNSWSAPWNQSGALGNQTMYCSDCHGSDHSATGSGGAPAAGSPWGPHGSNNNFILRGSWSNPENPFGTGAICFKCHSTGYRRKDGLSSSGFWGGGRGDLHGYHADNVRRTDSPRDQMRCTMCHVAVPHGWKNKAFLVNLNDVGPEGGQAIGTNVSGRSYTNGPYYRKAYLRIRNWRPSGSWRENDCGKSGSYGRDWMRNTCG
ncbi:hypothetical protein FCL40_13160 [Ferrimonas sediminicola]|uniref:Doubled CXXCH motif domain-containing protein n=1 Tax=Ferrimonas sediminicola TaxID=2569538 RepID=A0A4U1BCA6_9GAMM|nr:cytochrome c3 family protein [Ferrimonas sediminicola]TKB48293.1 hypothetical protein FCL40_13160 [Ferrimonas sediminicola]